ncbi:MULTISPECIES: sigma-70 family RNA polymerase sigma factor [Streptomyces]|uniref:sigma-70 family RNA polymerase sigma factor n=1 Tax=Streptomyces TaxID=1883 RepID=UPI003CFA7346
MERVSAQQDCWGSEFLRALYARQGPPLFRHVLRLLNGDHQRAEDIVQETFLRAWQHREELTAESAAPWLHTVAHHLVVSAYRRRAARPQESLLGDELPTDEGQDDIERALESWHMIDALRALSPEHRAVLVHVYYLRRSVAEAAEHLGVPRGTVKSRCYYALRALRAVLEERGVTAP